MPALPKIKRDRPVQRLASPDVSVFTRKMMANVNTVNAATEVFEDVAKEFEKRQRKHELNKNETAFAKEMGEFARSHAGVSYYDDDDQPAESGTAAYMRYPELYKEKVNELIKEKQENFSLKSDGEAWATEKKVSAEKHYTEEYIKGVVKQKKHIADEEKEMVADAQARDEYWVADNIIRNSVSFESAAAQELALRDNNRLQTYSQWDNLLKTGTAKQLETEMERVISSGGDRLIPERVQLKYKEGFETRIKQLGAVNKAARSRALKMSGAELQTYINMATQNEIAITPLMYEKADILAVEQFKVGNPTLAYSWFTKGRAQAMTRNIIQSGGSFREMMDELRIKMSEGDFGNTLLVPKLLAATDMLKDLRKNLDVDPVFHGGTALGVYVSYNPDKRVESLTQQFAVADVVNMKYGRQGDLSDETIKSIKNEVMQAAPNKVQAITNDIIRASNNDLRRAKRVLGRVGLGMGADASIISAYRTIEGDKNAVSLINAGLKIQQEGLDKTIITVPQEFNQAQGEAFMGMFDHVPEYKSQLMAATKAAYLALASGKDNTFDKSIHAAAFNIVVDKMTDMGGYSVKKSKGIDDVDVTRFFGRSRAGVGAKHDSAPFLAAVAAGGGVKNSTPNKLWQDSMNGVVRPFQVADGTWGLVRGVVSVKNKDGSPLLLTWDENNTTAAVKTQNFKDQKSAAFKDSTAGALTDFAYRSAIALTHLSKESGNMMQGVGKSDWSPANSKNIGRVPYMPTHRELDAMIEVLIGQAASKTNVEFDAKLLGAIERAEEGFQRGDRSAADNALTDFEVDLMTKIQVGEAGGLQPREKSLKKFNKNLNQKVQVGEAGGLQPREKSLKEFNKNLNQKIQGAERSAP